VSIDLEHALRRALDATDGVVRASERDLVAGAVRGHRRRRVVRAGVAGAAVLVVAIAAFALFAVGRPGDADQPTGTTPNGTTPTGAPDLSLDPATARPIEEVWPQAIRTLPARLPNGQDYNVLGEVEAGTFVVQAKAGFERYGSIYRYEAADGTAVELIDAQALNPSTTAFAPIGRARVLDGRYVAVQTLEGAGEPSLVEVVSVADGSRVARVDLPPGDEIILMAWAGDHLLWTGGDGGVHSAADPASVIPGSEGFYLAGQGAWAIANGDTTITWWDVATGERHEAPAGRAPLPCFGRTCVTPVNDTMDLLRIVGVGGPGGTARLVESMNHSLTSRGDHFVVLDYGEGEPDASRLLWDLSTNTYAGLPTEVDQMDAAGGGLDILVLSVDSRSKVVVNLTAI
jgi:hypothetical protein